MLNVTKQFRSRKERKSLQNTLTVRSKVSRALKEIFGEVSGIYGVRTLSIRGVFEVCRWEACGRVCDVRR